MPLRTPELAPAATRREVTPINPLTRDALLLYVHLALILTLATLLTSELAILRSTLSGDMVDRIQRVDRWYGIVAGLVVVSGLSLLFYTSYGPIFFTHNPVFWVKMGIFGTIAVLSIPPTIAYLRWDKRRLADRSIVLDGREFNRIRGLLWAQVALFVALPLCATLMVAGV